ncbi:MAG: NAD(P)H-hydrate dehydratase [Candidatus Kryptoniota bacterium]
MQKCDRETISQGHVAGETLMANASHGVSKVAEILLGGAQDRRIAVFCGRGNNGGDGLGAALNLAREGANVDVYLLGNEEQIKGEPLIFLKKLRRYAIKSDRARILDFSKSKGIADYGKYELLIDAIFGTGLSRPPEGESKEAIEIMNASGVPVLAVDIPSGIDANSGKLLGVAPRAIATATMAFPKRGLLMNEGRDRSGHIYVVDIGMPDDLQSLSTVNTAVITCEDVARIIPYRPMETHKNAVGKIFGFVGSAGLTGAGVMAGLSAMRSGAGAVVLGVPESLNEIFEIKLTEVMTVPLPETRERTLSAKAYQKSLPYINWADVIIVGPGLSRHTGTAKLVYRLLENYNGTIVVDADALNAIADRPEILKISKAELILTPHFGEFSRISKISVQDIPYNRIEHARKFAVENKVNLVLKGSPTVVATKNGTVFLNIHGNPGMATAGMGDVLTGTIAAIVAQKVKPHEAAIAGVYLHSVAGDLSRNEKGIHSLMATDVIEKLPDAFRKTIEMEINEFEEIN